MANQMAEWPIRCPVEETAADGTACPTTQVMNTHGSAHMDTGSRRPHGCMREPKPPSRSGQQIVFTPSAGIPGHSSGKCSPKKGGNCKEASQMFACMLVLCNVHSRVLGQEALLYTKTVRTLTVPQHDQHGR